MTIDALALTAIRTEAEDLAQGCRIQKIISTGPISVVLEVYNPERRQRVQLMFSADVHNARFHLMRQKASQQPGEPTPFLLLLRKYIRYGIITAIEQLPFERIIILTITKKFPLGRRPHFGIAGAAPQSKAGQTELDDIGDDDDDKDEEALELADNFELYQSKLVCEMMGRHSNIMLLSDEEVIIDAIKRVAPSKNRYRLILPHQQYVAPPAQAKQPFHLQSRDSFSSLMRSIAQKQPDAELWQSLVSLFSGVGPQLGRELAFRLGQKITPADAKLKLRDISHWELLYSEMRGLLRPLVPGYEPEITDFSPSVARDETEQIIAFAPYELLQFKARGIEPERTESVSQAAEEYYGQSEALSDNSQRKAQVAAAIEIHHERLRRRASSMEASLKKAESAGELKRKGETIYAHLWEISSGQALLEADGISIVLNPDRSASENAQYYFREYDKGRQALAGVPELLEEAQYELSYLDEMLTALDLAETYDEVMAIKAELLEGGYGPGGEHQDKDKEKAKARLKRPKKRKLPQTPAFNSPDDFTIYVGKSAQHNDYVTFELGERGDIWLHARGLPGSHVIIKTNGKELIEVPDKTLEMAASLAAYYSKAQTSSKVEVIYALQKYVRKVKGPHPGLVTYSHEFGSINSRPQPYTARRAKVTVTRSR